jgi:hypothetical protein
VVSFNTVSPDREQQLAQFRWLRDHAEEVAAGLRPGDVRTAGNIRHGAQQNIDLLEGKFPLPRR